MLRSTFIGRLLLFAILVVIAIAVFSPSAKAHIIKCPKAVSSHTCDHRNAHHGATALTWVGKSNIWGLKRRTIIKDHIWLKMRMIEKITAYHDRLKPTGVSASWAWYQTRDTQCVVNHEGGWDSPSIDPPDVYAGRFQMDYAFERETAFGRKMSDRYGRAWNWPPWAQVYHAWEVWSYAGWSRWPTYAKYCA